MRLADGSVVSAPVVVSNVGPAATVRLIGREHVPADYLELVDRADRPTAMLTVNFASRERLIEAPAC